MKVMGMPPMNPNPNAKGYKDIKITICPADKDLVPYDFSQDE